MTFHSPLNLLIYQMIQFRDRPANGFFDQKGAIIVNLPRQGGRKNLVPFQLILDLDLDGNIEIVLSFSEAKSGFEFLHHPNHNTDPIPTSYRLSEINFTSFCPDLTISPFIITPQEAGG